MVASVVITVHCLGLVGGQCGKLDEGTLEECGKPSPSMGIQLHGFDTS
jgi:hypothetical protein